MVSNLLKKGNFEWNEAFVAFKKAMTTMPDFSLPFTLETHLLKDDTRVLLVPIRKLNHISTGQV